MRSRCRSSRAAGRRPRCTRARGKSTRTTQRARLLARVLGPMPQHSPGPGGPVGGPFGRVEKNDLGHPGGERDSPWWHSAPPGAAPAQRRAVRTSPPQAVLRFVMPPHVGLNRRRGFGKHLVSSIFISIGPIFGNLPV